MKNSSLKKIIIFLITISIFPACNFFGGNYEEYCNVLAVKFRNQDSKISLIDNSGKILVEDEFPSNSRVTPIGNLIKEELQDGQVRYWKLENKKMKQIGEDKYNGGTPFFEKFAVVRDDRGMLSLINDDGKEVISNISKIENQNIVRVGIVSDGLIRFKNDEGLWGYIDINGKIVIRPTFISCENFSNGKARVMDANRSFFIINKNGEKLFTGKFGKTYLTIFGDNIPYKEEDVEFFGVINFKSEKLIRDTKFKSIIPLSADKLAVSISDKEWGVCTLKGDFLGDLRTKFETMPLFSNSGEIVINEDKKVKIFSKNGTLLKEMEDYKSLIPIGNQKYLAQQRNKKFTIIDNEGKELSKDPFELIYNNASLFTFGNTPEAIDIQKNLYTIESNFFDFDQIFSKTFIKLSENGVFGINSNNNIPDVLMLFPYYSPNAYSQSNEGQYLNKSDDYSFVMIDQSKNYNKNNTQQENSDVAAVDTTAATVDTTIADTAAFVDAQVPQPKNTIKDDYPFLYTWDETYSPQQRNFGGVNISLEFHFDQYLKQEKIGVDPIFTNQTTIIGYSLNNNAKLKRISARFSFGSIDSDIFWKEFEKKAKLAGFVNNGRGMMTHKIKPSRTISFGGSGFDFYF
jgi:hypothetical protein